MVVSVGGTTCTSPSAGCLRFRKGPTGRRRAPRDLPSHLIGRRTRFYRWTGAAIEDRPRQVGGEDDGDEDQAKSAAQAALRKSLKGLPAHEGFANHHAHNLEISAHNRSHVASHPLPSKTINGNGAAGRGGMPSLRDAQHVLPHRKSEGLTTSAEAAPAPASLAPAASAPARVSLLREFWKPEDTQILKILLPSIANIMLVPLAGAVDLFWVGRMSCAVSLAGQSAGNQVFNAVQCIIVFLPAIVTPLVSKANASGSTEEVQRHIGEGLFVAGIIGVVGGLLMFLNTEWVLKAMLGIPPGTEMATIAVAYVKCRAMGFVASSCNSVLFAAFRGMLKVPTSLKIMIVTQVINAALDPFMIFGAPSIGLPAMGVAGAAFATSISEWICTFCFVYMLYREKIVDMASLFRIPSSSSAKNFILNGAALQMRFALLRLKDIYAMRAVVAIGTAGTAAAANALSQQMFTLGGSIMMALGLTATALVPKALHNKENGSPENAKALTSRLMKWSALMGVGVGVLQMCALPIVLSITSLPEVQAAAVGPCLLACAVQVVNGIMLCSEGVVRAHRQFRMLLVASAVGAVSFLGSMPFLKNSLEGIWICLGIATAAQMVFLIGTPYVNGRWVEKAKAA